MPSLLAAEKPHLLLLQETRHNSSSESAIRAEVRALDCRWIGHPNGDVAPIALRGINIAPLAPPEGQENLPIARYGLEIGGRRILVRNRHANAHCVKIRAEMNRILDLEDSGCMVLDCGDFKKHLTSSPCLMSCFGTERTFRANGSSDQWTSNIDGAAASPEIAHLVSTQCARPFSGAQHCPVRIVIRMKPVFEEHFKWVRGESSAPRPWCDDLIKDFERSIEMMMLHSESGTELLGAPLHTLISTMFMVLVISTPTTTLSSKGFSRGSGSLRLFVLKVPMPRWTTSPARWGLSSLPAETRSLVLGRSVFPPVVELLHGCDESLGLDRPASGTTRMLWTSR